MFVIQAVKDFNKIKKKLQFYKDVQEVLEAIVSELYWRSVNYPTYAEITKSSQEFTGQLVSFSGFVYDIVEYNGKTLMVLSTNVYNNSIQLIHEDDVLIYYDGTTDYLVGDGVSVVGTMKGRHLEIQSKNTIGKFLNSAYSFSTSGYSNVDRIPVIKADQFY